MIRQKTLGMAGKDALNLALGVVRRVAISLLAILPLASLLSASQALGDKYDVEIAAIQNYANEAYKQVEAGTPLTEQQIARLKREGSRFYRIIFERKGKIPTTHLCGILTKPIRWLMPPTAANSM